MHYHGILVHYAELAIKGKNRINFVRSLAENIRRSLADEPVGGIERYSGRLWIYPKPETELGPSACEKLSRVIGVANFSPALHCELELGEMKRNALALVADRTYSSFRVRARRVFKELPLGSLEVDHEVGGFLHDHKPAKVQMRDAELEVGIEMLPQGAFLYTERNRGLGGLPAGSSGVVACLISGGIDSPVAAYRMLRRGCRAVFIHFHSQPFLGRQSEEKAKDLVRVLTGYQGRSTLHLVPFGELQREIVTSAPVSLRVVLYRRFMMRVAAALATRSGAKVLVTGESVGQVASQTLTNISVIDEAAPLTVLRPLIAFDKQEIIDEAKRLGTYEISIQPDQDCCQLFVPKDPETHAKLDQIQAAEDVLDIEALCADTLARTQTVTVNEGGELRSSGPQASSSPTPESTRSAE